jgi:hypothetical protein
MLIPMLIIFGGAVALALDYYLNEEVQDERN